VIVSEKSDCGRKELNLHLLVFSQALDHRAAATEIQRKHVPRWEFNPLPAGPGTCRYIEVWPLTTGH
jgi:hypothetical protein